MPCLREFFFPSGPAPKQPDRHADHHDQKYDLDDQKEEAGRDPNQREEKYPHDFPQQESDDARGGYAENGFQNGQAPKEAITLRRCVVKSVTADVTER